MPFQYTFRADDLESVKVEDRDLMENRDRELELYLNQPSVKLRRAAAQSISPGTYALINFDTEDSDEYGFYPSSGGTLTVPAGLTGLYVIGFQLNWSANPTSSNIFLRANSQNIMSGNYLSQTKILLGAAVYLGSGDTIDLRVQYDAGSAARTATATLWMARVLA